ncbi:hypothetical protein HS125_12570 [bacterium]|nr:hypothetical protein [bacterium]
MRTCVFILCAVLAGGCGFFARFGFDKSVAQAEEAKQKAVAAEANRFAGLQFAQAERTYQEAMALKDQGQYPEAKASWRRRRDYTSRHRMAPGDECSSSSRQRASGSRWRK